MRHYTLAQISKYRIRLSLAFLSISLIFRIAYNLRYLFKSEEEKDIADSAKDGDLVYPTFILIYYGFADLIPMAGQYVAVRIIPNPNNSKKINQSNNEAANMYSTSEETIDLIPDHEESIIRGDNSENTFSWLHRSNPPEDEDGSSEK